MTRQDFIENVTTWWELLGVCSDHNLRSCENVYDEEGRDDYIDEYLEEYVRENGWRDVRDALYNIPTGYDYYCIDSDYGISEIDGLGDYEFDDYKDAVLDEMDENELWDEDEDDEEPLPYTPPVDTTPVPDEPLSMDELMSASQAQISVISNKPKEQPVEVELEAFIGINATIKGGN